MNRKDAIELIEFFNGTIYAEQKSRWYKVYRYEPDVDRYVFEAGYHGMPADYRIDDYSNSIQALSELEDLVDVSEWKEYEW